MCGEIKLCVALSDKTAVKTTHGHNRLIVLLQFGLLILVTLYWTYALCFVTPFEFR